MRSANRVRLSSMGFAGLVCAASAVWGRGCTPRENDAAADSACACTQGQGDAQSPAPAVASTDDGGLAPVTPPAGFAAQMWESSESCPFSLDDQDPAWFGCPHPIRHMLERQPDLSITAPGGASATQIEVDPSVRYQAILGIGISMEEASVYNLRQLSAETRAQLLTAMLDPVAGMGLNLIRVTMGTSDFTDRDWYTYDDLPLGQEDPALDHFSIQKDIDFGIIEILREMMAINPQVKFFASPWSPPAWMKSEGPIFGQITGGFLSSDAIGTYAKYFRKFVEAYRDQGIPIEAVTLQNEPENDLFTMPSCVVSPDQEATLAKAVKGEFAAGGLDTAVWVFDQNFDHGVAFATAIFGDSAARSATDGVAFHDYAGDPSAMTTLHERFPDKDIFFTEKTLWGVAGVDRAAQYFRNWARSYVSWITMLDQNGQPNRGPASEKPRRFMRSISYSGGEYYATPEHYLFGLYSKFVQRGATRIASSPGSANTVTDVAFLNPDNTVVTVVINQTATPQPFALLSEGNQIQGTLDAKSAASVLWLSGQGASPLAPVGPKP